jgi:hypothetical protein
MQTSLKKFIRHPPALKKTLFILMALAVWSFFLWRAFNVYGPGSDVNNVGFNSDSAIPVLMSNEERPSTVFNLYYYGTDRWGAWAFLATHFIHRATGYRWTDQSLFMLQTLWLFVGALVFAALSRRDLLLAALVYLTALCLHTQSRLQIFELSQLYAWQTTALLFGWYALRRMFEFDFEAAKKRWDWKRSALIFLTLGFSLLAVWSSNASIVFLMFLLHLEALRARLKTKGERIYRRLLKPYAFALISIVAATLIEWLLKMNFHRHALKHYGQDFKTSFHLDIGYLAENLGAQLRNIGSLSWWPLYLLSILITLALACSFLYALFKKREGLLEKLKTTIADDTMILAIGAFAIAAMNFTLAVMVDHVRLNQYDSRFLTLTNLFCPISGMLMIFLIFKLIVRSSRFNSYAQPAFIVIVLLLLTIKFPAQSYSNEYKSTKEAALALAQKAPRGILMGGYWETYVFTALQPENAMTAVPLEGYEVRMPWTRELVRRANQVIVEYRRVHSGGPVVPPERLNQYGSSLRLVDPKWYENDLYAFALYVNETQERRNRQD